MFLDQTTSTRATHVLCNLPPHNILIICRSLRWLVQNDFPVMEWAFFHLFFEARHDPPKFLIGLPPPINCRKVNFSLFKMSKSSPIGSNSGNLLILAPQLVTSFLTSWTGFPLP